MVRHSQAETAEIVTPASKAEAVQSTEANGGTKIANTDDCRSDDEKKAPPEHQEGCFAREDNLEDIENTLGEVEEGDDLIERNAITAVAEMLSAVIFDTEEQSLPPSEAKRLISMRCDVQPPKEPVLGKKATALLDSISSKMIDPTKNLADLLAAIDPPADGVFSRAYMIRRKNACGAMHLLTAEKGLQRIQICWTKGVLESLRSVMKDAIGQELEDFLPNFQTRDEYRDARRRAVATLMNLSVSQENRVVLFHSPDLIPILLSTISSSPECSKGGAATLAHLSKTKENRPFLARMPSLFDTVADILEPRGDGNVIEDDMEAISCQYDEYGGVDLRGARQNMFALLFHLGKEKDNAYHMARCKRLVDTLAAVNSYLSSEFQAYACKVLANLSRHHGNTNHILSEHPSTIQSLVTSSYSHSDESRKLSCRALQNFAQDKPCRAGLASIETVVSALCERIHEGVDEEEKLAALNAIKSLSEEPSNLIVMTNTVNCMPTLLTIADGSDDSASEMMRHIASDAMANFSAHCRLLATCGKKIDMESRGSETDAKKNKKVEPFVPSFNISTCEQWK